MKRSLRGAAALLAMSACVPALAADYLVDPPLRPAYNEAWSPQAEESIRFEYGAAYWYAWGGQNAAFGPVSLAVRDQTHIGELHGKIDDLWSQTYLSGRAGIGLGTSGTYEISPAGAGGIGPDSRIGYVGADFGWLPLGTMKEGVAAGGFIGYHYWKDAPDIGTGQYATGFDAGGIPTSFGEARDDFDTQALRLGVRATAEFDMFDIQAEAAWLPYAHVSGALGGSSPDGFLFPGVGAPVFENAQTTLSGRGQGVMLEAMAGFHPTESLVLRVGGRAWYLEGNLDAVFNGTAGGVAQPAMTLPSTYASLFRYGLRAELTGKF